MSRSLTELAEAMDSIGAELRAAAVTLAPLDALIHGGAHPAPPSAAGPPPATVAVPPPLPMQPITAPAAAPVPVSPDAFPWVPHVKWTVFGTKADEAGKEWDQLAYSWFTATPGSGKRDAFCAVPWACRKGDAMRFRLPNGRIVRILVGDCGPWNTRNRWAPVGARPAAESGADERGRRTNLAGVDLTPAAAALITGESAETIWDSGTASGYLDCEWDPAITDRASAATPPAASWAPGPAIAKSALDLEGQPFHYLDPVAEQGGVLGCADVVSVALIHAGILEEREHQLSVDGLDALLRTRHFWTVVTGPYQPGDVIVWDPFPGQKHPHVGVLVDPSTVVHNSSSEKAVVKMALAGYNRPIRHVLRAGGLAS